MADTSTSEDLATLSNSIEALALDLALRDLSATGRIAELAPVFAQIAREAAAAGIPGIHQIASGVSRRIDDKPGTGESIEQALRESIDQMHAQMEQCTAGAGALPPAALNQDPELVGDFILESREHLSAIEAQLLFLEHDPRNAEAINTIFRGFHTIKGLAGFLEYPGIQQFAHEVETLLDLARNGKLAVDSDVIDLILHSADYLRQCLNAVEAAPCGCAPEPVAGAGRLIARVAELSGRSGEAQGHPDQQPDQRLETVGQSSKSAAQARSVKVDTSKLDCLVDMVGELVIAQSLIRHDPELAAERNPRLSRNLTQLSRITADVQKIAMAMRMIPVGQMFQRMARLVRDLARKSGKEAVLELSGQETELDRNMVEELADPLMHMVRNAVDHGAERPEDRLAAGKNPTSTLRLKAFHQGGFIMIEVSDDGRGLAREKILAKARQRGLVSGGDQLSDQEVFSFIFEPGFSTAEQVTAVSGRGVGMDVVRKQIMKLRGRVDIHSRPGEGCTFTIKLPLTLAIIDGLVAGVGAERYIVPLFTVREMFRPAAESLSTLPDGSEMALVRGAALPIVRLHRRFGVTPRSEEPQSGILIVAESERRSFCLLVDTLLGKQEVVIKSLGETFRNVPGVAGGCILGDGRVGLILDVEALFENPAGE